MTVNSFTEDVLKYIEEGIIENKESRLLFDYKNRNPLDYQAGIYVV